MSSTIHLEPQRTALIVIDMQNDFCHAEGFFARVGQDVSACAAVVPRIARLLDLARRRGVAALFTLTEHQPGTTEPERHRILPERDRAASRSSVCLAGSWGARILDELEPRPGEDLVRKRRYSAFYETDLEERLRRRGIDTLVVTGVTTNVCVDSTVRDAYFRGFDVVLAADCVASFEPHLHAATLENVRLLFGAVLTAAEVAEALGGD